MTFDHPIRKALYGIMLVGMLFSTPGAGTRLVRSRAPVDPDVQSHASDHLQDYGLLSRTEGWALAGNRLYWTDSDGLDWNDITPVLPTDATLLAASFLRCRNGLALLEPGRGGWKPGPAT